jgi:hypothetical protein
MNLPDSESEAIVTTTQTPQVAFGVSARLTLALTPSARNPYLLGPDAMCRYATVSGFECRLQR